MPDQRLDLHEHASIATAVREDASGAWLDVTVTCLGRDYGGPGVLTGEIVTYWSSPMIPQIAVHTLDLGFGTVAAGDTRDRSFHINNVGQVDLVVSVSAAPPGDVFQWPSLATTLAAGASVEVMVEFSPTGEGIANGVLAVQSNAPGSPQSVTFHGRGTTVINPP